MKKIIVIFISMLLGVSCSSNTKDEKIDTQFLDLSGDEYSELVSGYWVITERVAPQYPASAARNRVSGCVDLVVGIGSEGRVEGYKIRSSYPKGVFDDYAVAAVGQWRWKATEENVDRTPVVAALRLDFTTEMNPSDPRYLENCPSTQENEELEI